MNENEALIDRFYKAFAQRDHETMAACYAPQATFSDPVFRTLSREETVAMWRMFCTGSKDLTVSSREVSGSDAGGTARWDAHYTFPKTGRKVHNVIHADFVIDSGHIVRHVDSFDFYRWTRMALGPLGVAFGWSPMIQNKIRETARSQLKRSMASEGGAAL